jgi:hypothetical protein
VASTTLRRGPEPLRDPASFPGAFAYEHTDMRPGVRLSAHRFASPNRRRRRVAIVLWLLATGRIGGRR